MRITSIGHAGLLVETTGGTIVCDPWFEPAFFGSWFVFPRNDRLGDELMSAIHDADYLYVSHLHADHLDPVFLTSGIAKGVTVLLPGFPTGELEHELRALGFTRFVKTVDGETIELGGGTSVTIHCETAIADGPQGDSAIVIEDPSGRMLNQNDCRLSDIDQIAAIGAVDVHLLQHSGAIWYPMVYELDAAERDRLGRLKRESQLARAVRYVRTLGASTVLPMAGPPCFLDPELWANNDLDGDPANIFPDQTVFLDRLRAEGISGGELFVPGSCATVAGGTVTLEHPGSPEEVMRPFHDKAPYLREYQADWMPWIEAHRAAWPAPRPDLVERMADRLEPILALAPLTRAGIGASILVRSGGDEVLIDVVGGEVVEFDGVSPYEFRFDLPRPLLESVLESGAVDWSNALFLSCRFRAWRAGGYNEHVYSLFKSLSPERIARCEAEAAARGVDLAVHDEVRIGDWMVERHCPHRQADLSQFGELDGTTLTCTLHGWQFDLTTGECPSSATHRLRVRPAR